ncbi:Olfactory receptor 4E1, partial [Eschrichtius robustus]|nr:Olfactory receptor 4E1 [Eschrichtius robustus]
MRMEEAILINQTNLVPYFQLRGLTVNQNVQMAAFATFLIFYVLTMIGNILIVITIIYDHQLHTPMYFFLSNLSFIDVCHSTVTVPRMLIHTWSEEKLISFDACATQMFFLHLFACSEIFLLTVMAYDRYVAICKPLQYMIVMNWKVCVLLAVALWMGALTFLTIKLPYCGPDEIDNFFCDVPQVIKLAYTDTHVIEILIVSSSGLISVVCFVVLVVSCAVILVSLRQQISEGRRKALSTCAAHLTVSHGFWDTASSSIPIHPPASQRTRNEDMKNALNKLMGRVAGREKK